MTVKLLRSAKPFRASHKLENVKISYLENDKIEQLLRKQKARIEYLIDSILEFGQPPRRKNYDILEFIHELKNYYNEFNGIIENYEYGIMDKADIINYIRDNQDLYKDAYFVLNMDHFDIKKI